ncbi:hypothetical protein OUZ56_005772 [Daphnia magna]|uniref:Uncharacterized protein n=1 Tax=Daphnia magna TaxID=35525 RepID=A0ABQ9YTS6_9CRUS|nr:hypothetical protein OUZ56_005772 [Daphnia magna]
MASALAADKVGIWIEFQLWWIKAIISENSVSLCITLCFNVTFDHYIQLRLSICKGLPIPFYNPQRKYTSCVFLCISELDPIPSFLP